jgi:hypothetical protein
MPSPLSFLRAGPPPPKVALLPDAAFFTRALPIAEGATAAQAAEQIELGLEAVAPFPLAQLYYGWCWQPGSAHALVFAAYRRRFTSEQAESWTGAEVVIPAFAAALGAAVEPGTTLLLDGPDSITGVHWGAGPVPSRVLTQELPPDSTADQRAQAHAGLVAAFGGSRHVVALTAPLAPEPLRTDREFVFRAGDFVSRLPVAATTAADVRDKADLAALRTARRRDLVLWRVALGLAASLLLLGAGEFTLVAGRMWQQVRERQFTAQKPLVDKVTSIHELTNKIEELATKRLMPLEMMTQLTGVDLERKPPEIQFTRIQADQARGLYTIFVEGRTSNAAQVGVYESTLRKLPAIARVDAPISQVRGDQAQFTLTAQFKPEALLHPEAPKPATP